MNIAPSSGSRGEPVAVVGMACRFPGADGPSAFWRLLIDGRHAIGEIPPDRFDVDAFYAAAPGTPGRIMTRWGGFLDGIDQFDAAFFGISPREADRIDPQQRLLLELTWEALEDAGCVPATLAGSRTGVFVGMWLNEYESRLFRDPSSIDFYMTTGSGRYTASGRLSHVFGFEGPSLTVDTACSSSLVAVHLACQSLWSGECSVALAGAANVLLEPFITLAYSQSRMMAPDGRCKFGDAAADGYVRSDGAAVIVLKPLARAIADGDPIYATILGSAVNNDGASSGSLGTPDRHGQEVMLRRACEASGIHPSALDYVEAHGTGTRAGDPVELSALGRVLGEGRDPARPCRVGSVKTNIGHTEAAAGLAGLIKVALALRHRTLPASLHLDTPSPHIPWSELPIVIQRERADWPAPTGRPRLGGVSSFGIGGTNGHVILAEDIEPAPTGAEPAGEANPRVLMVSSRTPEGLRSAAGRYAAWLRDEARQPSFPDICYTAALRRTHHEHRVAVVAPTCAEAAETLDAFVAGEPRQGLAAGESAPNRPRLVFVFPGQGSQWLGMARALLAHEPAFRDALEQCDAAVRQQTGWSVVGEVTAEPGISRLSAIDVVQPTLFSIQVALASLWRAWGITPDAVVGHSMGEIAAAHVAGALSLEDAAAIICRRSALLRRTSGRGAMAVVDLSLRDAERAIARFSDRLSVAVSNSSRSTVLSGEPAALDELLATLEAGGTFCRRVNVDVASHSPQMDALRGDLLEQLAAVAPRSGSVPFRSTVVARVVEGETLAAEYWTRNLRDPVLFAQTVRGLIEDGHRWFIEMSPHPLLVNAVQEIAAEAGTTCLALPSCRRDEDDRVVMLGSLAGLHCAGATVDWRRFYPSGGRLAPLPPYPWQRERFWFDAPVRFPAEPRRPGVLGTPLQPLRQPNTFYWEVDLAIETSPYLADHRVRGACVVPAAWYIDLAAEAARRAFGGDSVRLENIQFGTSLVLQEPAHTLLQISVEADTAGGGSVRIESAAREDGQTVPRAIEHAHAVIRASRPAAADEAEPPSVLAGQCTGEPAAAHYAAMEARGLGYGPAFRRVTDVRHGSRELLARIDTAPPSPAETAASLRVAVLDSCFQLVVAAIELARTELDPRDTVVPVALDAIEVRQQPAAGSELWCHVRFDEASFGDTFRGNLRLIDQDGRVLVEAAGLQLFRIARERDRQVRDALHHLAWRPEPRGASTPRSDGPWLIVGSERLAADLAAALSARGCDVARVDTLAPDSVAHVSRHTVVHVAADGSDAVAAGASAARAIALVQAVAAGSGVRRLWFITTASQAVLGTDAVEGLAGSPIWGLRSVVASEYPALACTAVDLGSGTDPQDVAALIEELLADGPEQEVALRAGARYVRRLRRGLAPAAADAEPRKPAAGRPYRVVTDSPGILDGLTAEVFVPRAPRAGEVEIEVAATGLNFMNVMSALGVCPGYPNGTGPLGIECAGRIVRVGDGVDGLRPGDEVMAFAHDSLATHAVVEERLAARIPSNLAIDEAAAAPIAFLTASYALEHIGRLKAGDRVLIHSATGGVGLAALQIARLAGAEVFATAGSPEKRVWLEEQGVDFVFDSRSLEFAGGVLQATRGEGVDVVLNSLPGDAMRAGLSLLREGGRFLEIGKRDIYENRPLDLFGFHRNVTYSAVDLDRLARERPEVLAPVLRAVVRRLAAGELVPLPTRAFPVSEIAGAFQLMARGAHTGKIVIRHDRQATPVRAVSGTWAAGTCLVTGGTGGLGLVVARWLAERGARSLVLVGRRGENAGLTDALRPLRESGVTVRVMAADVAQPADVRRVIRDIETTSPPLLGVVHAAGILEDATLARLAPAALDRVLAPKIAGAWHLHEAVADLPLEFFVLFSSVTSFIGSGGQANYACGNAFLDALARYRRARGLPAMSINWGPWSEVGLAAADEGRGGRLSARGLGSLNPDVAIEALAALFRDTPVQAVVMSFDPRRWCDSTPGAASWPLFSEQLADAAICDAPPAGAAGLRASLEAAPPGRARRRVLEEFLQQTVAKVLRLAPSRVDMVRPLQAQGLDSLMGLELRNRLEAATGVSLPPTMVFNYPTVAVLAPYLAGRMKVSLSEPSADDENPAPEELLALLDELERLPEDEARALLAQPLESEGNR